MKLGQVLQILLITGYVGVLETNPALSQEVKKHMLFSRKANARGMTKQIPRLSEIRFPITSAQRLVQSPTPSQVVEVTGVKVNRTNQGLEVILETSAGEQLQVSNRSEGNRFIAEIKNGQLRLPTGNTFRSQKPAEGITSVVVANQDANTIRVTVTGETGVPKVELFDSKEGLIFTVTSEAPQEQQSQDSQTQTNKPSQSGDEPIELVVTATRTEEDVLRVSRSVTIIDREEIEQQTRLSPNLVEILGKTVPGLAAPTQSASNFGQSLRGRNISVLIDGIPQSTTRNASRDLRTIDPQAIERVEVVRGPSAIYGDGATGGIINIITRRPSEKKFTARTEVGLSADIGSFEADGIGYNIQQFISGTENNFDFALSFGLTKTGGFFDADGDRIPSDANAQGGFSDARSINLFSKIGFNIDDNQRLQLTFNRFDERQDTDIASAPIVNTLPGRQKARALEGLRLDELPRSNNSLVNLQYNHDNLFNNKVQAQLYYRDYLTRFFPFDGQNFPALGNLVFQSRVESEKFGGRLQIETPLSNQGAAKLLWGVDYVKENTSQPVSSFDRAVFNASNGLVFRKIGDRSWTPPLELSSLGLFAQLNWDITKRLIVNGGVRYENSSVSVDDFTTLANPNVIIPGGEFDFDATLFNIGAVYLLTNQLSVFANFSQGFSLADTGLALRNATPSTIESLRPEPQKVNNYEIGIRGRWDSVQASLSGFYNESDLGTTFTAPGTVLRAPERVYGVEAALDVKSGDRFSFGGTLTLIGGEIDTNNDSEYESLDGFRIPPLKLTAYVENETLPGWRNRLQLLFSGNREVFTNNITAFGRRPVESYFTVDYISSIGIGSGSLQIGIENLFNNQYFPVASQLQSNDSAYTAAKGRTLSIRYTINW